MGLRNKIKEKYEARAAKVEQKQMEKLVKAAERKSPVVVEYTSLSTMGDYDILVNGKPIEGVFGDSRTAQRRAEQIEKILREKGFEVL
jgi:hypothetical protein